MTHRAAQIKQLKQENTTKEKIWQARSGKLLDGLVNSRPCTWPMMPASQYENWIGKGGMLETNPSNANGITTKET